jgi:hypothetical protein
MSHSLWKIAIIMDMLLLNIFTKCLKRVKIKNSFSTLILFVFLNSGKWHGLHPKSIVLKTAFKRCVY